MPQRITKILDHYNLTPSEFAEEIDYSRSSISHVITKRNKVTLDFIAKIKKRFPELNSDWLISGQGEMFENKVVNKNITPTDLFSIIENENFGKEMDSPPSYSSNEKKAPEYDIPIQTTEKKVISDSQPLENNLMTEKPENTDYQNNKIKKIILLYENGKFESFEP